MDDDSLSLIMFFILYALFIIYLKFMENLTIIRSDFENLKCNPLYLLVDSMVSDTKDSNKKFEGCIKKAI